MAYGQNSSSCDALSQIMCICDIWHHKMSRKLHLLVLRYRHFYAAKNEVNKKILTDIIKFISILENGNSGIFGIILKLVLQGRGFYQT